MLAREPAPVASARGSSTSTSCSPSRPCSAPSCAQDLALFVAFFDLMLIPFYFLIGHVGRGPDRVAATIKLVIYTLVGSLLMLAGGDRHRRARRAAERRPHHVRALGAAARLPLEQRLAGVDLPVLRGRVPGQDAGLPAARLDARRLPGDADRGAGGLLAACSRRSAPTASCAIVLPLFPQAARALPDADAADRAGLDPLRLGAWRSRRPTRA